MPASVAVLWLKKHDPLVNVVRLNVDWAEGMEFCVTDVKKKLIKKITILNIYTPLRHVF